MEIDEFISQDIKLSIESEKREDIMRNPHPHVLVVPYPAQGHVIPLMELSHELVKFGFKITFLNTDFNHNRIVKSLVGGEENVGENIKLVSVPDGLEPWEDRTHFGNLTDAIHRVMPQKMEELIEQINKEDSDAITSVIASGSMGLALEVAEKMGIRRAVFWPSSAARLALNFCTQKLVEDGIIDNEGTPLKDETVELSADMPVMRTSQFAWASLGNLATQKTIFNLILRNDKALKTADCIICNSANDLESGAFAFAPEIKPIGPLSGGKHLAGNFWPQDSNCLQWLDQQPSNSVIYVAFGSSTIFGNSQLQELAMGLELCNRPFLWVVRPDMSTDGSLSYIKEFEEKITPRGKIVDWAPQREVLSHSAVGCFISHCGWNSTLEGVTNGLPFLCWPYFADQFLNESYICDIWKIGLNFVKNEDGIVTRTEIVNKIDNLLDTKVYRERALKLKEVTLACVEEGGSSYKNFEAFVKWMKA